ncbi:MAG: ComEC family competence protein [Bacteroidales bacterium]|nr:ComEC family competence protein [Bacteroidales bacterium]
MIFWHRYPFIRLIMPFMAGIILAFWLERPVASLYWLLAILFIVYLFLTLLFTKKLPYRLRWLPGLLIYMNLIIGGYQLTILNTPKFSSSDISNNNFNSGQFIVRLNEPVSEKPRSFKVVAKVTQLKDSTGWEEVTGKLILYFEKDSLSRNLEYGDLLLVQSTIQKINPPLNPGEFNYRRYLANKGIYFQGYVKKGDWEILDKDRGSIIKSIGAGLRNRFLNILEQNGIKGEEFAVASAILLGYDDKLDAEQKQAFSGAGAMHILCVSGLHVGIISVILSSLLFFLNRSKWLRILKTILLLLLIWLYALITGFSPSVMRASIMFSFLIVGQNLKRKTDIYNTLAASAFTILLIDPYLLLEVGFQLSYLAVIGIVAIYKPISSLVYPRYWLIRKIWQISVVSFAATLATFPLSLFYFHQFPNLFLVTNLVAIPASMLIIYLGIMVLLTSFIPLISNFFALLLVKLIWFLNFFVKAIEGFPFSTVRDVYITFFELVLILLIIIAAVRYLQRFNFKPAVLLISLILFLFLSFSTRSFQHLQQRGILIYHVKNNSAIDFYDGKGALFLADSSLLSDRGKINYHINNSRIQAGLRNIAFLPLEKSSVQTENFLKNGDFIAFYDKSMLRVDKDFNFFPLLGKKIKINYLLISQNTRINVSDLMDMFDFEMLIIDSSNAEWYVKRIRSECEENNIPYYCVGESGALCLEI